MPSTQQQIQLGHSKSMLLGFRNDVNRAPMKAEIRQTLQDAANSNGGIPGLRGAFSVRLAARLEHIMDHIHDAEQVDKSFTSKM